MGRGKDRCCGIGEEVGVGWLGGDRGEEKE